MVEGGWERFVRKNHGYRCDTHVSAHEMLKRASEEGIETSAGSLRSRFSSRDIIAVSSSGTVSATE